ncbi:hypothetical protein PV10_03163 [Exophiala mesophila]|uniref:Uncharacterized protein n=1 Tax=Exophiala mesophila TaxID=212818 RepID=A0A0D1ZNK9_EXOME|nr:uncharacterized protein PV10_03163 [Exophiala mesophila]KIV95519.1 hypothetical protein PV10_03163 [Exophiala mesophila]
MHLLNLSSALLLLCTTSVRSQSTQLTDCGFLGPVYPTPPHIADTKAIREAKDAFTRLMDSAMRNGSTAWGPVDAANSSISFAVFSTQSDQLLSEYHHLGSSPGAKAHLTGGKLDGDTVYRLGSVTKLLSVYTFLAKVGPKYWSEPVTNHVPELVARSVKNSVLDINWSEVTLGSLAGQISGIPHDYALTDLSAIPGITEIGLPDLPPSEVTTCGAANQEPCSGEEFFRLLLQQHPVAPVSQGPNYSNEAYQLLSLAYQNITGESFADAFRTGIVEPLKLKRTFYHPPTSDINTVRVDPKGANTFEIDIGGLDPAGGAWASLRDFASLGRSMLNSTLLPAQVTRDWLKPNSHSSNLYSSVGKPWEILRMAVPVSPDSTTTRFVDLYTKSGGLGGYNAWLFLSPDHNIGIAALVASLTEADNAIVASESGMPVLVSLAELALATWIPAAEAAARESAASNLVGSFKSEDGLNSSISLDLVPDHQGICITNLIYNGTDFLETLGSVFGYAAASLQYTNLHDKPSGQLSFRAVWQSLKHPISVTSVIHPECSLNWSDLDNLKYGDIGLDQVIITVKADGKAVGVEMPGLRTSFSQRVK